MEMLKYNFMTTSFLLTNLFSVSSESLFCICTPFCLHFEVVAIFIAAIPRHS